MNQNYYLNGPTSYIQSWLLKKINTINNETVDFDYMQIEKPLHYESGSMTQTDAILLNHDSLSSENPKRDIVSSGTDLDPDEPNYYLINTISSAYINQIKTDLEIVTFKRGVTINGYLIKHLLNAIEIRDLNGDMVKKIVFNYTYTSPNKNRNPYDQTMPLRAPYHVLLTSVSIGNNYQTNNEVYTLEYNIPRSMQGAGPDQWGYYKSSLLNYQYDQADLDCFKHPIFLTSPVHSELGYETLRLKEQQLIWFKSQPNINFPPMFNSVLKSEENITNITNFSFQLANRTPDDSSKSFILTKINNPLGGYAKYDYEPNQCIVRRAKKDGTYYYNLENGAGLRVANIVSKSNTNAPAITTRFYYKNPVTKGNIEHYNLLRFFSGFHYNFDFRDYEESQSTSPPDTLHVYDFDNVRVSRTFFSTPDVEKFSEASQVMYQEVTRLEINEQGIPIGKVVSQYNTPRLYYSIYNFNKFYGAAPCYFGLIYELPKRKRIMPDDFDGHLYLSDYSINRNAELLNRTYYDSHDKIVRTEKYDYLDIDKDQCEEGYKTKQLSTFPTSLPFDMFRKTKVDPKKIEMPMFEYGQSRTNLGYSALAKKEIIDITPKGTVQTLEKYNYDDLGRLKTTITSTNNALPCISESIYPMANTELYNKNMHSTIVEQITKNNGRETLHLRNNYADTGVWPLSTDISLDGKDFVTNATYKFDIKGNIIEYTTKDGSIVSYVWSYNYKYPIAEIKGAMYSQIETAIKTEFGVSSVDELSQMLNPDVAKLQKMRFNKNLQNAYVTTFVYKPLIGVVLKTDPLGVVTTYDYDNYGRLKSIKDSKGKVIKSNNYHYQNEK
ncbi:MAG: hypothetical protein EOM31_11630 [Bacteroidia bacterium]|nr:hypothetical protein [Bacteroidia bacterium]